MATHWAKSRYFHYTITQIFPTALNDLKSTGYNEDSDMSINSDAAYIFHN